MKQENRDKIRQQSIFGKQNMTGLNKISSLPIGIKREIERRGHMNKAIDKQKDKE